MQTPAGKTMPQNAHEDTVIASRSSNCSSSSSSSKSSNFGLMQTPGTHEVCWRTTPPYEILNPSFGGEGKRGKIAETQSEDYENILKSAYEAQLKSVTDVSSPVDIRKVWKDMEPGENSSPLRPTPKAFKRSFSSNDVNNEPKRGKLSHWSTESSLQWTRRKDKGILDFVNAARRDLKTPPPPLPPPPPPPSLLLSSSSSSSSSSSPSLQFMDKMRVNGRVGEEVSDLIRGQLIVNLESPLIVGDHSSVAVLSCKSSPKNYSKPWLLEKPFELDLAGAIKAPSAPEEKCSARISPLQSHFPRYLVMEVMPCMVTVNRCSMPEKKLRLLCEVNDSEKFACLREDWYQTLVSVGDHVRIVGDFDENGVCIVDNDNNLVITLPDVLISATQVASSFSCIRRAVLENRHRKTADSNQSMIFGQLLHELFQRGLIAGDFSVAFLNKEIELLLVQAIQDLYAINETMDSARTFLRDSSVTLKKWADKFVSSKPKPEATVHIHRGNINQKIQLAVTKVLDIEETIWSPKLGLKGNIDASLEVRIHETGKIPRTMVMPLEFKTGSDRSAINHRAQASLYSLMMADQYDTDVLSSILFYSKTEETIQIPKLRDEIRGLILGRNNMAFYLSAKKSLPPVLQNHYTCKGCFSVDTCMVYHKGIEGGTEKSSGLGHLFDSLVGHMTQEHCDFFTKWIRLVTLEEGDSSKMVKQIWNVDSKTREEAGSCFSNMKISKILPADEGIGESMSRYSYILERSFPKESLSLLKSSISVGDPIVVSTEDGKLAVAIGHIVSMTPTMATIAVNRRLDFLKEKMPGFDDTTNQLFTSKFSDQIPTSYPLFRIDKQDLAVGYSLMRANLVSLFTPGADSRKRELVVDLAAPRFSIPKDVKLPDNLNPDQVRAVSKVLSALDYVLILGMPGTGKTTTISMIIKTLISQNKSVLLSSYTHSAVDNVLLKLRQEKVDFLRLGTPQRTHPDIEEHLDNPRNFASVDSYDRFCRSKLVVATTCLKLNHPLLAKRRFDFCIIDEASQLTLPVSLGPLQFSNTFVLVGDHYQLPPLVRNITARDDGLNVSLFRHLCEAHPEAVVNLEYQYRMCQDIMLLSNVLIYRNRLRCGNESVAHQSLVVPNADAALMEAHAGLSMCSGAAKEAGDGMSGCWLSEILLPSRRVIFLDTDLMPAPESRESEMTVNYVEAELVFQMTKTLIAGGVSEDSIGIISPLRSQLKVIGHLIKAYPKLEALTVDKYQGRDKECIILSLVRSNPRNNVGELLRDWRRLNVALTRAKKKLIVVGSRSTLRGCYLFEEFFSIIEERGWDLTIPVDGHLIHSISAPPSQVVSQRHKKLV